ncbi:hypothetical protein [Massilia sp. Root351]|uniref:hypothetical protein n=1 Tax=Massilia sp. Root351 TaxID=1736522 RepID=UPI0012F6B97B|nr:hypothetical protein [Massilia sp. Root351]
MDDLFQNPEDSMEVEPVELEEVFADVLSSILAKRLANQCQKPWADEMESEMQEKISALVALANDRNLRTIRVIVTRPSGQKVVQDMDVKRIGETRSLQ